MSFEKTTPPKRAVEQSFEKDCSYLDEQSFGTSSLLYFYKKTAHKRLLVPERTVLREEDCSFQTSGLFVLLAHAKY